MAAHGAAPLALVLSAALWAVFFALRWVAERLAWPHFLASGKLPLCEAKDMHKQRLMHAGDAAVRLVWKLLWSWRR
jgi:hypothetical protein